MEGVMLVAEMLDLVLASLLVLRRVIGALHLVALLS